MMWIVLLALAAPALFYLRYWIINNWTGHPSYDEKIRKKRDDAKKQRDEMVKKLSTEDNDLYTEEREKILALSIEELLEQLKTGILTAVAVLDAYKSRALAATLNFNCVTEFIEEADEWASELDKLPVEKRKPLHGLPISLKDDVGVEGYDSTAGLAKFIGRPCHSDAVLVKVLKSLGAVPFCRTNIPQTMLSYGCSNPVWGKTGNPHNPSRSPGGSSGGEGCLIGYGGSIVGIGSDIGGSARIPAAFCGIASIKPTSGRLSYYGFVKSVKGILGIEAVPGIIARNVDAVIEVSRHMFGNRLQSELDPLTPLVPWNEKEFSSRRPLKIGYYLEDDYVPATPGMKRAVKEAVAAMIEAGHEVVPFRPPEVESLTILSLKILQSDGGNYFKKIMFGERVDSILKLTKIGVHLPHFLKRMLSPLVSLSSPKLAKVLEAAGGDGTNKSGQLWAAVHLRDEYVRTLVDKWKKDGLDLLICPGFACPAPESGLEGQLTPCGSYTILYNTVNFPAGVVPVSKETAADQEELKSYPTNDKLLRTIAKTTQGALGLPLSVQVVGLPWQEELVLRGMKEIEKGINAKSA